MQGSRGLLNFDTLIKPADKPELKIENYFGGIYKLVSLLRRR